MFYEVTSIITKKDQCGNDKECKEKFFIDKCEFFAEAEMKMLGYYNNENLVVAIKQSKVREFVNSREDEDEDIFIAVIEDIFISEKDGSETRTKYEVALFTDCISNANKIVNEYMKSGLQDMELVKLYKTKFVELI